MPRGGVDPREPPLVQAGPDRHAGRVRLHCERLEDRRQLAAGVPAEPAAAPPELLDHGPVELPLVGDPAGLGTPGRVTLPRAGFLDATLASLPSAVPKGTAGGEVQLVVRDAEGAILATSVGSSHGATLSHYLPAGTYDIALVAPQGVIGTCIIAATPAVSPGPIGVGRDPIDVSLADVNLDGNTDLVVADQNPDDPADDSGTSVVAVFLGVGGGRFAPRTSYVIDGQLQSMNVVDVTGDKLPDIIGIAQGPSSTLVILAGGPDGVFESPRSIPLDVGAGHPVRLAVAVTDDNGHAADVGHANIVVLFYDALSFTGAVSVIQGDGRGGFSAGGPVSLPVGDLPRDVAVADVNGDEIPDILTAHAALGDLSPGDGRPGNRIEVRAGKVGANGALGASDSPTMIPMPGPVSRIAPADMNHDGKIDVVAGMNMSGPGFTQIGSVAVALNRSRRGDAALLFTTLRAIETGTSVDACRVDDVNGDGHPDVVTADGPSGVASVLAGFGDGVLGVPEPHAVGQNPTALALGDVDGNGRLDVLTADTGSGTVTILGQRSDGSFPAVGKAAVGTGPAASACADLDGDGRIDVVTVNSGSNDVSVLLGAGDGTFRPQQRFAVGLLPQAIVLQDMNADGRIDAVVTNAGDRTFTVLFGLGDGTFDRRTDTRVETGGLPYAIAATDVDGDGWQDVVVTTIGDGQPGEVAYFRGERGGLSFTLAASRTAGFQPTTVTVANVDRDERLDIVVANRGDGSEDHPGNVTLWSGATGTHGWTFGAARTIAIGGSVFGATVGDVDGDSKPDLVVSTSHSHGFSVVTLAGDGGFSRRRELPLTGAPTVPLIADADGDGRPDIVVGVDRLPSGVAGVVALTGGDDFASQRTILAAVLPSAMAVTDFNADGRADMLVTTGLSPLVVTLGLPDGSFAPVGSGTFADRGADRVVIVPAAGGFPGGMATLDRSGAIRVRVAGGGDVAATAPRTGFDLAVVTRRSGPVRIATIDADRRGVSLYDITPDGTLGPRRAITVPAVDGRPTLLSRIRAADVDADGTDDIVASDPGTGRMRLLLAGADGSFAVATWRSLDAGAGVSQFVVADADGDGRADIVAANQISGDVSVWLATPAPVAAGSAPAAAGSAPVAAGSAPVAAGSAPVAAGSALAPLFGPERRFRAAVRDAAFATDPLTGRSTSVAAAPIDDVAVADVDGDRRPDILVTSAVARSFAVLSGLPGGGFSAPREYLSRVVATPQPVVSTRPAAPRDLATGDFDGDGRADMAMLDREGEQVLVYLSSKQPPAAPLASGQAPSPTQNAGPATWSVSQSDLPTLTIALSGNAPTSLLAADAAGSAGGRDGVLDLLVGNAYGDVLVLRGEAHAAGRPTGRFARSTRAEGGVALAATDVDGDGVTDFVYGDRSLDRVAVSAGANATIFAADQAQGVIGPSAVATVREAAAGLDRTNLVVANGAANEVLVFLQSPAAGSDAFLAPRRFFVGTNPTALAVADVDANGIPDVVVANGGSNDVSVLLGRIGDDGRWTLVAGPRLATGGTSPAGVAVADVVGLGGAAGADGIPDIVVTNRGSNSAALIAGVGAGFFADGSIRQLSLPAGAAPTAVFALPRAGSSALVVLNSGANSFSTFDAGRNFQRTDVGSGGVAPRAAALYTQAGTTSLAVGNAVSGNVAVFLASAGRLAFEAVDSRAFAGVSGLAFDASGRLYGTAAGRDTALELYSFSRPSATADSSVQALRALINFLPLGSSVGLVATLVTSAGIPVTSAATAANAPLVDGERPAATGAGEGRSLGGEGEARDPVAEDPAQRGVDVAESQAAPLLRLFLDVEDSLRANNGRLLETLLSRAADPLDLLSAAHLLVAAVARRQDIDTREPAPDAPAPAESEIESPARARDGDAPDTAAPQPSSSPVPPPRRADNATDAEGGPVAGPRDATAAEHAGVGSDRSRRLFARFTAFTVADADSRSASPTKPPAIGPGRDVPRFVWPRNVQREGRARTPGFEGVTCAGEPQGVGRTATNSATPRDMVDIPLQEGSAGIAALEAAPLPFGVSTPSVRGETIARHALDAAFAAVGWHR